MEKIGFVGTGVMGSGIINNLLQAGYQVVVYNRTKAHAAEVLAAGATWADTPKAVAQSSDVTFTMVGFPADVEAVYYGAAGIFAGAKANQLLVDMTTSTPTLAKKLATDGQAQQFQVADAPVSGGDIGAKNGTLTVMVGATKAAYEQMQPILKAFSQRVNLFGGPGLGQHAKMANQIMIAGTMTGLTEMLVYAQAAGLNLTDVLATLHAGGADNWSMNTYAPRILQHDYTPGFFAKHFLKDLRIALDEAKKMKLDLPATKTAAQLYEQLVDQKQLGNDGTQALIKLWWPAGDQPTK
ncbi:NAD(P)-dependent oxidoreductase [Loigolactobacillus backii]|uniref:Oxidoreductase n=1 Tax=Loigolactobacillus backii TaxID=375175 RepID=A0A192H1P2_9LACO|nr:NAD(P)-dependent oxidoreductase [Loigolactobacillus backii]ANK60403.1 oxidoreductase [Loigolactobacillus backii]ANK62157.1 oxidoreductase [Loigolactobacillus backii]ANK65282.1 oxidoreductase [Loigolactobacillus backii]ANK67842.1 oxidoreductase [Loigolactobacillus backii]ANK70829.1 oxidoreductase [Loigolactobacillus backii]